MSDSTIVPPVLTRELITQVILEDLRRRGPIAFEIERLVSRGAHSGASPQPNRSKAPTP